MTAIVSAGCSSSAKPPVLDAPTNGSTSRLASIPPSSALKPVSKVLVFIEENHSLEQMKGGMPYAYGLARTFGYATDYTAITHPSLPNYLAIASGSTHGITDDMDPAGHELRGRTVLGQAIAAGMTAATYVDGMPNNCALTGGGNAYAPKHNPWAYFVDERASCMKYDVPIAGLGGAISSGRLPTVGMVIPNLNNDAHDGPLGTADAWFKGWMTKIMAGSDWTSGRLVVVLTADEDDRLSGNKVLTIVMNPRVKGQVVTTPLSHYSLTRFLEEVARTPFLDAAKTAPSLRKAFGLG